MFSPQLAPIIKLEPLHDEIDSLSFENTGAYLNRLVKAASVTVDCEERLNVQRCFRKLSGRVLEARSRSLTDQNIAKLKKDSMASAIFDIRNEIQRIRMKLKRDPTETLVKAEGFVLNEELFIKRNQLEADHRKRTAALRLAAALSVVEKRVILQNYLQLYTFSSSDVSRHLCERFGRSSNRFALFISTGSIQTKQSRSKDFACKIMHSVLRSMYRRRLNSTFTRLIISM